MERNRPANGEANEVSWFWAMIEHKIPSPSLDTKWNIQIGIGWATANNTLLVACGPSTWMKRLYDH